MKRTIATLALLKRSGQKREENPDLQTQVEGKSQREKYGLSFLLLKYLSGLLKIFAFAVCIGFNL